MVFWALYAFCGCSAVFFWYLLQIYKKMEEGNARTMETVDKVSSSSSSAAAVLASGSRYEVFLSFRGADTRKNFTDHLYNYLTDAGICTFRDNEDLRVGKEIGPDLLKAIEESTISIPIFSKGYASSKWCLTELTHMVICMRNNNGHTICPIFYDVTPSEVKHQTGSFGAAFLKHKRKVDEGTIQEWKDALVLVAELKGWEKDKIADGHEGELVKEVFSEVCIKLKKRNVNLTNNLVGMDHHVKEMEKLLDINGIHDVLIVGIHGMGGIGKTTIAKFIYNKLCDQFQQQCSFLEDIREKVRRNGYDDLRRQLMFDILKRKADPITWERKFFSNKKVLVVLDDVVERSQLTEIIGNRDWFGPGSRFIVTTRNKDVFEEYEGDLIYSPKAMNFDDSMVLFCKYAFRSIHPTDDYENISRDIVSTAAGLPLHLVVIGSLLFLKKKRVWETTLEELRTIPPDKVQERLRISYDTLTPRQQQIFLDIACHFIGEDNRVAFYMWKSCGFHPASGIQALISLSLINIESNNTIRMHDHLRDLGRDIVCNENLIVGGERSRLWSHEEAAKVLDSQSGTNKVQTFFICPEWRYECFSNDDFKALSSLRYLHLEGPELEGDFRGVFSNLSWLRWRFQTSPMEVSNFRPSNLVILDLSRSNISDGWERWIQPGRNLKVLNLTDCRHVRKTPNFSAFVNLERLILQGCSGLTEICPSIIHLKRLIYLDAVNCPRLKTLPMEFGSMTALEEVYLGGYYSFEVEQEFINELPNSFGLLVEVQYLSLRRCTSLVKIPESFWNLTSLVELDLSNTGIEELSEEGIGNLKNLTKLRLKYSKIKRLPDAIGMLDKLQVLNLRNSEVEMLPNAIGMLTQLESLQLNHCDSIEELPEAIGNLCNLKTLNLSFAQVKRLPVSIERLQKLEELDCSDSSLEGELPDGIRSLSSLRLLDLNGTVISSFPTDISGISGLLTLNLGDCFQLQLRQQLQLPSSLTALEIPFTASSLDSVARLLNLKTLHFYNNYFSELVEDGSPRDMSKLSKLEKLTLEGFDNSCSLPMRLDTLSQLNTLGFVFCKNLLCLPDLSSLQMLTKLTVENSNLMMGIRDLGKQQSLEHITINYCFALEALPDLSNLKRLKELDLRGCEMLREIKGLEVLTSLQRLTLPEGPVLTNMPDLSHLKGLKIITKR